MLGLSLVTIFTNWDKEVTFVFTYQLSSPSLCILADEILHVSCFDTNRQRKLQTELETKMIQFQDEEKHWILQTLRNNDYVDSSRIHSETLVHICYYLSLVIL